MAGLGICILCRADTCVSYVHPAYKPIAPYRYLPPIVYCLWQISHIQTCLCVVVGQLFASTSPNLMRGSASHPAGPLAGLPKAVNRYPIAGSGKFRHNVHTSF